MVEYWIAGIGTLALALITFFIEVIKPNWNKPKFSITFNNIEPYCRTTIIEADKDACGIVIKYTNAYWIRLKITNSGRSVAKRCIGKLVKVTDIADKELVNYDPVTLHWVGTDSHKVPLRAIDLNPTEYEYLDVLETREDKQDIAFICTDKVLRGIPHFLPRNEYKLRITIYGDNVKPVTAEFLQIWKDENFKHIRLETLKNVSKK